MRASDCLEAPRKATPQTTCGELTCVLTFVVPHEIQFYETEGGRKPVEEFLDSLPAKDARKVAWVLELIEEMDRVPAHFFKKMVNTDELWEVRVRSGSKAIRLLGFLDGAELVILAHGFLKKKQKTPRQAIRLAEARKKDYWERKKDE